MLQHGRPESGFTAVAMALEGGVNLGVRGLDHDVLRVGGKFRAGDSRERPAGPGAPAALVAAGLIHAIGVVLEVHTGIAKEKIGGRGSDEPRHRSVGQRMSLDNRLVATEVGAERTIEAEESTGGEAALPEGVAVLETGKVEFRAAIAGAVEVKRAPIQPFPRDGQVRTRRQRSRHARAWCRGLRGASTRA